MAALAWDAGLSVSKANGDTIMHRKLLLCIRSPHQAKEVLLIDLGVRNASALSSSQEESDPLKSSSSNDKPSESRIHAQGSKPSVASSEMSNSGDCGGLEKDSTSVAEGDTISREALLAASKMLSFPSKSNEINEHIALGNFYVNSGAYEKALSIFDQCVYILIPLSYF